MEIGETFEEWDELDSAAIEELESLFSSEKDEEDDQTSDTGSTDSEDEDEKFKCLKCKKVYQTNGWLKRHESSCNGAKQPVKKKSKKLSEHQTRTREVLAGLGFREYFRHECLPALIKVLTEVSETPNDVVLLRGSRFAMCKDQANVFITELKKIEGDSIVFFEYVAEKLWTITFARDNLLSSSRRQLYVAQHFNEFRNSQELSTKFTSLSNIIGLNSTIMIHDSTDKLLLQKVITTMFENISRFRLKSVASALQIRENYVGETANKLSLSPVERDIVAYIAGYVCRKVRDKIQRYCDSNHQSSVSTVQEKCKRLSHTAKLVSQMIPAGVGKQAPTMTYPNLMTLSLSRGGLTQVDHACFTFFCYLEISIRPFLNLARFRSSTRKSDSELLEQLIDNSSLLQPSWPYSKHLSTEDSNILLKLFVDLYYRIRKWAYLKVYKEQNKFKETLSLLKEKSATTVDLHGKDSIRKALMSNTK
ncbi:MAG: hypothetical protein DSY43_01660 [Gammaproteobacteria bacterium]|nr:MAG: hypothetical protein DSY43_01660 [Gammaproteobacteria bacterium]